MARQLDAFGCEMLESNLTIVTIKVYAIVSQGITMIDMPAGPSEVCVIADEGKLYQNRRHCSRFFDGVKASLIANLFLQQCLILA